ncbi:hypothetical protein Cni_G23966 [Canna indica]|uniref:Uncharacterized protein n=1 Tax=Canna indica TaxID=4628 RepID=A0AAQ3KVC3_9LILI|nr:hypothetical protein Cni_G23966 [Canna indica]
MEAISTLIFSAAGFPDLPELCVLRHVLTERYGSSMESYVNSEFVEKIRKKSFPEEEKLQTMQSIAKEFALKWDSKIFHHKLHNNAHATESAVPKKVMPPHTANRGASPVQAGRKEEIPSKGQYGSNPIHVVQTQVQMEPKDIHVISTTNNRQSHDRVEKIPKVIACGTETAEPCQNNKALPPYDKRRTNHDRIRTDGLPQSRTKRVENDYDPSLEKQELNSVKNRNVKPVNTAPPDTKPNDNKYHVEETRGNDLPPPYAQLNGIKDKHHVKENNVNIQDYQKSQRREEGSGPTGLNKQSLKPVINDYVIPPYIKPSYDIPIKGDQTAKKKSGFTEETGHCSDAAACDQRPRPVSVRRKFQKPQGTEISDRSVNEDKPASDLPDSQRRDSSRQKTYAAAADNYVEEKSTIRESRLPIDDEADTAIDFGKLLPRASSRQRRHSSRHNAAEEEKAMEKLLLHYSKKGTAKEHSRERTRARAPTTDHVDSDRVEYPGNGRIHPVLRETETRSERRISLPSESVTAAEVKAPPRSTSMQPDLSNPNRGRVHPNLPQYSQLLTKLPFLRETVPHTERTISLSSEPVTQAEVKGPARATSMQPDLSNLNGVQVHPNLPQYSQLFARIAAIRNT